MIKNDASTTYVSRTIVGEEWLIATNFILLNHKFLRDRSDGNSTMLQHLISY